MITINSCKASTQQPIKDTDLIQLKEIQSSHNNVLHTMSDSDIQCLLWKPQLGNKSQSEYGSTWGDCALSTCSRGEHRDEEDQFMEEQLILDQLAAPSNTTLSVAGSSDRYTYTEDLKQLEAIPKANRPNRWRLILDLSSPHGQSVNDGIKKEICSLRYPSIDNAVEKIVQSGPGMLLAKGEIEHAY